MRLNKNIVNIFAVISILSITTINAYGDNGSISISNAFTYEDGMWSPGSVESKDFHIENNSSSSIKIDRLYLKLKSSKNLKTNQILDIKSKQFKELANNSIVKLTYEEIVLFEDELVNLLSEKGIVLAKEIDIESNENALLNITIDMNEEMDNDAQSLENIFSIGIAYKTNEDKPTNPESPVKPDEPNNPKPPLKSDNIVDSDNDLGGKLPQTGGIINNMSLIAIGTITIVTGAILNKKSSKGKGGKYHE